MLTITLHELNCLSPTCSLCVWNEPQTNFNYKRKMHVQVNTICTSASKSRYTMLSQTNIHNKIFYELFSSTNTTKHFTPVNVSGLVWFECTHLLGLPPLAVAVEYTTSVLGTLSSIKPYVSSSASGWGVTYIGTAVWRCRRLYLTHVNTTPVW